MEIGTAITQGDVYVMAFFFSDCLVNCDGYTIHIHQCFYKDRIFNFSTDTSRQHVLISQPIQVDNMYYKQIKGLNGKGEMWQNLFIFFFRI